MKILTISLLAIFGCFSLPSVAQNTDAVPVNQDSVYQEPEIKAMHPKGEKYMRTFMEQNVNPATPVTNGAPEGTYNVQISILIDTAGKITAIPKTNHGYGMEKELLRVIKKFPDFIPAKQNGIPVKSVQTLPMVFMIKKDR